MLFSRQPWSDRAAAELGAALCGDGDYLRAEVEQGEADLWQVEHRGRRSWVITRAEGCELVVCCLAGAGLHPITGRILDTARRQGFASARAHSTRPGIGRMLSRHGAKPVETREGGETVYKVEF